MTKVRVAAIALPLLLASTDPAIAWQAGAPAALPLGELAPGHLVPDGRAVYTFAASESGILTVMLRGDDDTDLVLEVGDAHGATFDDGRSDMDLYGHTGTEHVSIVLRRPGSYQVRVSSYSGGGTFQIGGTWLPAPGLELPPDPDGSPSNARPLVPGTPLQETLNVESGDAADWYVFEASSDVAVTVLTEGEDDIYLEAYADGEFGSYVDRSDQDMQGYRGNESVTARLRAGERFYFKVAPFSGSASYTIRVGVM